MENPEDRLSRFEENLLAPYASFSSQTRGRQYPLKEHPMRTAYQRDRDRVIHCAAFRRMEYKTQVFVNHEGDNYRTRLTHTIEVAQISRSLARALRVNEDLAEAVALAHDLGHTPFGHAGEAILNTLLKDHGIEDGFSHNRQSLRVVDILEQRYPEFRGLNLTYEAREGIVKHETAYDVPTPQDFHPEWQCSLEGQIVNLADEIAYNSHDIDDGLRSRILNWEELATLDLWRELYDESTRRYPQLDDRQRRHHLIRRMIDRQVTDAVDTTNQRVQEYAVATLDDVRNCPEGLIAFSPEFAKRLAELKKFLFENI